MLGIRKKTPAPVIYRTPPGELSALYADMLQQPHLLIAGATGSGKSVAVNGLLYTASYRPPGDQLGGAWWILIDPKRVELIQWRQLPHVIRYASEPEEMTAALAYGLCILEYRYRQMQLERLRLFPGGDVFIIIDEYADLILTAKNAVVPLMQRITQLGRAAKVHLIICTQCPLKAVIDTPIKCNFDARLALRTRSAQDSRNITGRAGCELLPRYGVGLYMTPEKEQLTQIPMIPENALSARVDWWISQK